MTDKEKLDKLVAEIERLYNQSLADENRQAELGLNSAACTSYGKSKVCKELLSFYNSMQKEPKECMYSKDNFTDDDRKVLCDSCEEECRFNKKDEIKSVHAQHTTISSSLNDYLCKAYNALYKGNGGILSFARLQNMAIDITEWQKEQIIKSLCNHANIDQMVEKFEDKYKPEKVLDTEYYKRGIFDTIKAIKED